MITRVAAGELVTEAEAWLSGIPINQQRLNLALTPLWQATQTNQPALDTVVLGCTHFPLLKNELIRLSPVPLVWVDSGDAIARRVGQVAPTIANSAQDGRLVHDSIRVATY